MPHPYILITAIASLVFAGCAGMTARLQAKPIDDVERKRAGDSRRSA
jgi:hypothetical protein